MAKVTFKFGSRAAYDADLLAGAIVDSALYFLEDTNELYKGTLPIGTGHYYYGLRSKNESDSSVIARTLGTNPPVLNDICVVEDLNNIKDIFIFALDQITNTEEWKKLTGRISSSSIVLSDGRLLDDALNAVSVKTDGQSIVQNEAGILSLAGYGEKYWAWDADSQEYILQQVDSTHPWKSGLTPRVYSENGNFIIGWYEPNPVTVEGLSTDLTAIKQDIADLQQTVGRIGNPSTGLVQRVENLEQATSRTYWAGDQQIIPVEGKVVIPIYDKMHNGLVRPPIGDISNDAVLGVNGNWVTPKDARIGELKHNGVSSSTVEEYVSAVLSDFSLEWEPIKK